MRRVSTQTRATKLREIFRLAKVPEVAISPTTKRKPKEIVE
jgi:hypothetical protein